MKFNIIGFTNTVNYDNKHCVIHPGTRLVQKIDEPDLLWCPTCGCSYSDKEAGTDEKIKSRFGPNQQTRIISPRKQKKYYDKSGNEVTDPSMIAQIEGQGGNIISYHEYLPTDSNTNAEQAFSKRISRKRK